MTERMTTPHLPGKFIWFEHVSNDVARARTFYEPLFGWRVEAMPMGEHSYHMILNDSQGIGGFTTAQAGAQAGTATHWLSHLSVLDVDQTFSAALAAGAKAQMKPTDFAPVGRGALIVDPTGAALSLWKSANGDRPDADRLPVGDWYWNELWTPDASHSLAFYESVFGLSHEAMNNGEQGTYLLIKTPDGKSRAGIFESTDKKMPPMWVPYVGVADCNASADRAAELGAKVFMPPTDIPGVGRIATFMDPQGATLAMIAPQRS